MRQLASALELYFNDSQTGYPFASAASGSGTVPLLLTPNYIGQLPTAPTPADGSCGGNNQYTYQAALNTSAPTYTYTFCLGADTGGYSSGVRTLTPQGIK